MTFHFMTSLFYNKQKKVHQLVFDQGFNKLFKFYRARGYNFVPKYHEKNIFIFKQFETLKFVIR